jgi:Bardet-Biedl syndrome 5 protein
MMFNETSIPLMNLFVSLQDKEEDSMKIDDFQEIDNAASSEINSKFTAYLSQGDSEKRREPFYCKELGFAMEKLREGYTVKDLWNVMGNSAE